MNAFMKQLKAEMLNAVAVTEASGIAVHRYGSYVKDNYQGWSGLCLLGALRFVSGRRKMYFGEEGREAMAADYGLTADQLTNVERGFCYNYNIEDKFVELGRSIAVAVEK